MDRSKGGVHQRRTRFVKEYLLDQNATRAAVAAGYSEKTASVQGHQLLSKPDIRQAIDAANAEVNSKLDLTVQRVKEEIFRLCFYDPAVFFNENGSPKAMHEIPEDARRAIVGFETAELFEGTGQDRGLAGYIKKFKLASKDRALELAARHLKMLTDRVEVSGLVGLAERLNKARKRAAEYKLEQGKRELERAPVNDALRNCCSSEAPSSPLIAFNSTTNFSLPNRTTRSGYPSPTQCSLYLSSTTFCPS
jgi:phage terminase small subunit